VVADSCDRVAVMRQGEIVETRDVLDLFTAPGHPYTRTLLDSLLDEHSMRTDQPGVADESWQKETR
jgi:peptide/nickel transport system permease protein